MYRIEFMGSMASGKSTLYDLMTKGEKKIPGITRYDDIKYEMILNEIGRKDKVRKLLYWLIMQNRAIRKDLTLYKLSKKAVRAVDACDVEGVRDLVNHVLFERPAYNDMISDKVIRVSRFLRDISDFAWLHDKARSRTIIFDEFLIQRGVALSIGEVSHIGLVREYMKRVPLPELVIYTYGDFDVIKQRMVSRDGDDERKLAHLKMMIEISEAAYDVLLGRGCNLIKIDASCDISYNYEVCAKGIVSL